MGGHSLLQGIFPTQGLNPSLLHCRQILHHLSHQGRPAWPWHICQNYEIKSAVISQSPPGIGSRSPCRYPSLQVVKFMVGNGRVHSGLCIHRFGVHECRLYSHCISPAFTSILSVPQNPAQDPLWAVVALTWVLAQTAWLGYAQHPVVQGSYLRESLPNWTTVRKIINLTCHLPFFPFIVFFQKSLPLWSQVLNWKKTEGMERECGETYGTYRPYSLVTHPGFTHHWIFCQVPIRWIAPDLIRSPRGTVHSFKKSS